MLQPPPGLPTLPSASMSTALARTPALPFECCVWPIDQTIIPGRFSARILATSYISFSGTPVTASIAAGVYLAMTSSLTLSMP
jgi:hypothetical protein